MAGFENDVLLATNVNFDPTNTAGGQPPFLGQVTGNGQLLIGSSVAPFLRVNTLTSGTGISITNASGSITIANTGFTAINIQTFVASGTYTPTAGTKYCIVELLGGGGGGGGAVQSITTGSSAAGGGGAGGYIRKLYPVATITGLSITVGGGGAGGTAGTNTGTTGGASVLGVLLQSNGGSGGLGGANVLVTNETNTAGGSGGAAAGGDLNIPGSPGLAGYAFGGWIICGIGANSIYGNGGAAGGIGSTGSVGVAATGFGAGGSGATSRGTSISVAGGNGSGGIVIITEYI